MTIAPDQLNKAIADSNISKAELARRLNVSPQYVAQICSGSRGITEKGLIKFCDALNLSFTITVAFSSR